MAYSRFIQPKWCSSQGHSYLKPSQRRSSTMTFDTRTERRLQTARNAMQEMIEAEQRKIDAGECIFFLPNLEPTKRRRPKLPNKMHTEQLAEHGFKVMEPTLAEHQWYRAQRNLCSSCGLWCKQLAGPPMECRRCFVRSVRLGH
jgi:hypothetical protein